MGRCLASVALAAVALLMGAAGADEVPRNTLIVKGAWPSASDPTTPLPEGGELAAGSYQNAYFGLTLRFSSRWQPGLAGPPPSDSGAYVLAQIVPAAGPAAARPGHLLISAQDMFFTATATRSALALINYTSEHLDRSVYRIEEAPRETRLAGRSFVRFAYYAPAAAMHWQVLATEIRCHVVEFVLVSAEGARMAELLQAIDRMPQTGAAADGGVAAAGEVPLCIANYAGPDTLLEHEEPRFTESRFNSIPVRIVIDGAGRVKHIHFLRAFPDQAHAITDALRRWRFKPHLLDGRSVEVETGLVFGRGAAPVAALAPAASR